MTNWQRFGDVTWVNVDQVEVIRVEEQGDGRWELTAAFTSGRTHPLGIHTDRDLLVDCTDAFLRGEVGEHLRAFASTAGETAKTQTVAPEPVAAERRGKWWFRRSKDRPLSSGADAHPDAAQAQPAV